MFNRLRIPELKFITVEAIKASRTEVSGKGKTRIIFIPDKLREILMKYASKKNITTGMIFITCGGKPVDRSNIWRDMKKLCDQANVDPEKVFPHNLRHLFVRTFYSLEKDVSKLSDLLGHSSVSTTSIYTMGYGDSRARQVKTLNLVVCMP